MWMYPEFHGHKDEDAGEFLERFELAFISNHVNNEEQVLKLLRICLRSDARDWLTLRSKGS